MNYWIMNNVFAFIDTIPSLMNFSLPDYSSRGMEVSSAVVNLQYMQGVLHVTAFALRSGNLDMQGSGIVDPQRGTIDMDIDLVTAAKGNISRIPLVGPLVGYILAGDKKRPSITLKVTGNLEDPEVQSSALKDYITWPVETILRVVELPFGALEKVFSGNGPFQTSAQKSAKPSKNPE